MFMFGLFKKKDEKREIEQLKRAVQTGFNSAKQDASNLSKWVKHLNRTDDMLKEDVYELHQEMATLKDEVENLKNIITILGEGQVFKQKKTVFPKQTSVMGVLNDVQMTVQTSILENLSPTERAIVFVILNSDLKLSYEDIASMLGKSKATIRGQINSIKQKSEGLIEEIVGENSKKRVYIPERVKEILLKKKKILEKRKRERISDEEE